jgi:hypothetical protein
MRAQGLWLPRSLQRNISHSLLQRNILHILRGGAVLPARIAFIAPLQKLEANKACKELQLERKPVNYQSWV